VGGKNSDRGDFGQPTQGQNHRNSVQVALDAAKGVAPNIEVQLIDLGGMRLAGSNGGLKPGEGPQDDIASALAVLKSPNLGGLIIGSPAYFRGMSALCKAFLEDIAVLREPRTLADKPVGVLPSARIETAVRN
jgi:multimeric flavodoxin WrbA